MAPHEPLMAPMDIDEYGAFSGAADAGAADAGAADAGAAAAPAKRTWAALARKH